MGSTTRMDLGSYKNIIVSVSTFVNLGRAMSGVHHDGSSQGNRMTTVLRVSLSSCRRRCRL